MAVGDSITSIVNTALIDGLGEDPVTSVFPPDPTKRAILASQRFHGVRRAVLRAHPWNCCSKDIALPAGPTAPVFQYQAAYPVPSDFLRVNLIFDGDEPTEQPYDVIGQQILCDLTAPLNLRYVYDCADPTVFDALLVEAIAAQLAASLAEPLLQSTPKRDEQLKILEGKLSIARLVGSQENSAKEWDEDVWLRSRR